jgi:hypothetical protein
VDLKRKSSNTFKGMEGSFMISVSPETYMSSQIAGVLLTEFN